MMSRSGIVLFILFVVAIILGVRRCSKYRNDEQYKTEFIKKAETTTKSSIATFKKVLRYATYPLILFAASFVIILVIFTRWSKIKIFISYNVENEDVALEMHKYFNRSQFKASYLPYSDLSHDEIIFKVTKMIEKSHAVIAVPGNRESVNFTDSEIMAATVLKRPIIMYVLNQEQRLPNTAYTGYPHFDHFLAIDYFLSITFRHYKTLDSVILRGWSFLKNILLIVLVVLVLASVLFSIVKIFAPTLPFLLMPYVLGIILIVILIGLFLYLIFTIFEQHRLTKIVKQSQLTGSLTYDELNEIFENDSKRGAVIVNGLVKDSLKKRYE